MKFPGVFFQNVLYLHRLSDGSLIKELPLDIGSIVGFSGKKKQTEVSNL
jgi:prolyl oligopeptidase